jgi:hypothetical protein
MFKADELATLAEIIPESKRTAVQRFVIENEAAFEAIRLLSQWAATDKGEDLPDTVNLVGGQEQIDVFTRMATENGLIVDAEEVSPENFKIFVKDSYTGLSFTAVTAPSAGENLKIRRYEL